MSDELQLDRQTLVAAITTFLANQEHLDEIRASLEAEVDAAGPQALAELNARLAQAGADWTYYDRDPLARRIHHRLADRILLPGSTLIGLEHVTAVAGKPVVIVANHLSYSDANLLEVLLHRAGGAGRAMSDRLTVIAGPKVYSSLKRRFSSLCFGTIKTPQSSARSTDEAVMSARDVARLARETIAIARERQQKGDSLLVFIEGTRSRTGSMQRGLPAVTRYFDPPGPPIVPMAITGSERFLPVDDERLHTATVQVRLGPPGDPALLLAEAGGNRRLVIDAVGVAIARLLPEAYQGTYGEASPDLDDARRLSDTVFGAG